VEKTEGGKVRPVKVLEKERLVVQGVYGEMISAVLVQIRIESEEDGWM